MKYFNVPIHIRMHNKVYCAHSDIMALLMLLRRSDGVVRYTVDQRAQEVL